MHEFKTHKIIAVIALICLSLPFILDRWLIAYPDSYVYFLMIDSLKLNTWTQYITIPIPFRYRILYPILGLPFTPFMSNEMALDMVSVFSTIGIAVMIFLITQRYLENKRLIGTIIAFVSALLIMTSEATKFYGAVALTDSVAMFLMLVIFYNITGEGKTRLTGTLQILGVLVKEVLIFSSLHRLIVKRDRDSLILFFGALNMLLWTRVLLGWENQQLRFVVPEAWKFIFFEYLWGNLIVIIVPSIIIAIIVRWEPLRSALKDFTIAGIIYLPIIYLGMFHAYFDMRFLWPALLFTIIPLAVGLEAVIFSMMLLRKITDKNTFITKKIVISERIKWRND